MIGPWHFACPVFSVPPLSRRAEKAATPYARCALQGMSFTLQDMSASRSPSNSETSTVNSIEKLSIDELLHALSDHPPSPASVTARADAEAWLQHLRVGREMPTPQLLIGLLSALLQERALSARPLTDDAVAALGDVNAIDAVLIQDEPDYVHFPHRVDGENWEQCKSKMTHVGVRLVNPVSGDPVHGTAVQRGGLELMVELVNANTNETLNDPMLTGVAGGAFEQCAAASACPPPTRSGSPLTARMLST